MKKQAWKTYVFWIVLTEAVGALAGLLTRSGTERYAETVLKPPLSPPAIVFPIVWGILYALMGFGAARVYLAPAGENRSLSLRLYGIQLFFNFLWSILFFNMRAFGFAFVWLAALLALVVMMTAAFDRVERTAALPQIPYVLWICFALYLNFAVWRLNG